MVVVEGAEVVTFTFFTDFRLPSFKDFVLLLEDFFCIRLFSSFLKLNNGDAVASTIGNVLIAVEDVVVLLFVELLAASVFGLTLLRLSINIPEVAFAFVSFSLLSSISGLTVVLLALNLP